MIYSKLTETMKQNIQNNLLKKIVELRLPLLLILVQTCLLSIQPFRLSGDDPIRYATATDILSNSLHETKFSIITSGFFAFLQQIVNFTDINFSVIKNNGSILWIIWALSITLILRKYRNTRYILIALTLVYFSMITPYIIGFNSEVFSALGISLGLALILLTENLLHRILGWICLVIATANTPILLVGAVLAAIYLMISEKRLHYLFYPFAVLIMIILEATIYNGNLSFSKYSLESELGNSVLLPWGVVRGFGYPVIFGILGIILSFGRGIIFYIPTILTLFFRRKKDSLERWITSLLLITLAIIPIYGAWWAWYGGLTFGPRFFMLGCVAGGFSASEILYKNNIVTKVKLMTLCTSILSLWVSAIGIAYLITPKVALMCMQDNFRYEPLCWYSPEYSTILAPIWEGGSVSWQAKIFIIFGIVMYILLFNRIIFHLINKIVNKLHYFAKGLKTNWKF